MTRAAPTAEAVAPTLIVTADVVSAFLACLPKVPGLHQGLAAPGGEAA